MFFFVCPAGVWSLVAVGLFAGPDPTEENLFTTSGLFRGGGFTLLGAQSLYIVCCIGWAVLCTYISMKVSYSYRFIVI